MNTFKYLVKVFVPLILFLGLAACSESDDEVTVTGPGGDVLAKVRVIHTSYDAPAVDIIVDDEVAITDLAYGESSGYAELSAGTRNIKVAPAGTTTPVVIEADLTLAEDTDYTVYAVDQLNDITAIVSEDSREANSAKAKVRFIHASPDAPAVDIKLDDGIGPAVFSNAAFTDITAYAEVDGGDYVFAVTATGATDAVTIFDAITVANGGVYTVVAHGTLDNTDAYPFAVRVFIDADPGDAFADLTAATADVIVVHASPDAPGVDLLIDNLVVNSTALEYPDNTGYFPVPAGLRNVKVNASGTSTTVIDGNLPIEPNLDYSVFAIDVLSEIEPLVIVDDLTAPAAGNAHVRFIHLSPDAPAVDITLTDGTIVFGNIAFKEVTEFLPLGAGSYDLQVRVAGTDTVVLELPGISLMDGDIYTVFARGLLNGSDEQELGAEIIIND